MLEFTRSFGETVIRMKQDGDQTYFSAFDVATALGLKEKRIAVNKVVIEENGLFLDQLNWGPESILFMSVEYVIGLALKAEQVITKSFLKWLIEVSDVVERFNPPSRLNVVREDSGAHYATTQIAKGYGISARTLNGLLEREEIQYRVNNQWVLYSKYQDKGYTKVLRVQKAGSEDFAFHSYWTKEGVRFVESVLEKLGYSKGVKQLSLF